jgi:hypothetical protein
MAFDNDGTCPHENEGKGANHLRNEFSHIWVHRRIPSLGSPLELVDYFETMRAQPLAAHASTATADTRQQQ